MKQCYFCGEKHEGILRKLENHHYIGRHFSNDTILLCPNCHAKITYEQNQVAPLFRKGATEKGQLLYALLSSGATAQIMGEQQVILAKKLGELL